MSVHRGPFDPALTGYIQVHSDRGRLLYVPDSLAEALGLGDTQPRGPAFQGRGVRPHRIHIARVGPEPKSRKVGRRKRTVTIIAEKFGKLANQTDSAKRFLKSIIFDPTKAEKEPAPSAELPRPQNITSQTTRPRTARERPRSWAPGSISKKNPQKRATQRPRSMLWAEAKRRSFLSREPADFTAEEMRLARHSIAHPVGVAAAAMSHPVMRHSLDSSPRDSILSSIGTDSSNLSTPAVKLPNEKPLASGNGISIGVAMAEPVLFLQGFEPGDLAANRSTAMLRGSLHIKVTKPAKIKAVTLRFRGRAMTKWPEGIPPRKTEFEEVNSHINHTWPFFNAQFPTAESSTGADHVQLQPSTDLASRNRSSIDVIRGANLSATNLTAREVRKLSLAVNQSRSFGKGEEPTGGPTVSQRGYKTFQPGTYIYNFELPMDSHLPETIDVDLGSVKYELEATIERAGAFKTNLVGTKEVVVIRTPAEGSLEQVEPIAISRNWEDQLHYDIVISGKSFPLGAKVPIAFKLTPLAKVQCHRIKVFVTESIEYFCSNKRVHRVEPTRKVQLFEKRADSAPSSTFDGSEFRIMSGGGVPFDQRTAAARGDFVSTSDSTNLLGNLEADRNIGPTEMEFDVQLPSCLNMRERDKNCKLHFDTTYTNIQVHHWIKIVMRLSKPDANDSTKRRHFEISIDSPFHILSCRATQANTSLPAYSIPDSEPGSQLYECGCPGAAPRRTAPESYAPTLNSLNRQSRDVSSAPLAAVPEAHGALGRMPNGSTDEIGLARPQAAYIGGPVSAPPMHRPIHMLRAPSFNPPAFEAEEPPPALETPPPQYNDIASPTTGLADYFARLSDAYDEGSGSNSSDEDDGQRTPTGSSRVELPLTPGSRANRSMDEVRNWQGLGRLSLSLQRPTGMRSMLHLGGS